MKGSFARFTLHDALVTIVIATIADKGGFRSTRHTFSQGILGNLATQPTIKDKIGSLEQGTTGTGTGFFTLRDDFIEGTIVGDNASRQTRDIGKAQFLRQIGPDFDTTNSCGGKKQKGKGRRILENTVVSLFRNQSVAKTYLQYSRS
jgi:hypothetical protein